MRKILFSLSLVALLVVLLASGCALRAQKGAAKPGKESGAQAKVIEKIPVSVVTVQPANILEHVEVTGTLQPADEVTVGPRLAGRVAWVIGKVGTPVQRGMEVMRLEDSEIQTRVRAANAGLDAAKARLEQAKAAALQQYTATDSGIAGADAALDAAKARLEQAKAAVLQQSTSTNSGITTAEAGLASAKARLEQAELARDAQDTSTQAQIKSAEAARDAAKSRLDALRKGARAQERAIAEQNAQVAKAGYENDKRNYDRLKKLYDQGAVAKTSLDTAETKLQVSEAQYNAAKQQLSLIQEGARAEDLQAAEASLRQAEEGVTAARAGLKQVEVARSNVEVARKGVDQAQAALESARSAKQVDVMRDKDVLAAQAGVKQAEQGLKSARAARQANVMRAQDVLAAQASVQQAKETLTAALQDLENTHVFSPVDGVISARMVDVGESLGSNVASLKISSDRSLYFEAEVSELDATRLRAGQSVTMLVDALQGAQRGKATAGTGITGIVEKVVPVVDSRTRNFTVRVIVPRTASLFPGMFARGQVLVATHQHVLSVPRDAVLEKDEQQIVFVVDASSTARLRKVTLGASDGKNVAVVAGLNPGDQLVIEGHQSLVDGDTVKIAK